MPLLTIEITCMYIKKNGEIVETRINEVIKNQIREKADMPLLRHKRIFYTKINGRMV